MLKIDTNIPLPDRGTGSTDEFSKTAAKMKVGDSVLVKNITEAHKLRQALNSHNKRASRRKEGTGFRVWRIYGKFNGGAPNE